MNRPNLIVIVSDDQGYGDLSCMGATDVATPNLDQLAESGARCTDFYSNSPVCSPSRASLLTGRYPGNAGIRSILKGYRTTPGLDPEVPTMSSILADLGYRTSLIGKWHLGMADGSRPNDHGYDESFGFLSGAVDYFSHIHYGPNNRKIPDGRGGFIEGTPLHDLWENDEEIWEDGHYFTDLISDRAADYVRRQAQDPAPFYMHVAYSAPHYPMHAPQKYRERFAHLPWERQIMAAMISAMDDGIGRILQTLEEQGIRDDTIIFFMSDNGPSREIRNWLNGSHDIYYGGTTGGFRGHKFSLFDGGIRVPGIISWPAAIPSSQVITEPVVAMDILPTVLKWLEVDTTNQAFDGVDVSSLFTSRASMGVREIFWEQGEQTAVRRDRWKLVLNGQLVEHEPAVTDVFLSDLDNDPGESKNLAAEVPELAVELHEAALQWRGEIERIWSSHWLPKMPDYEVHVHPGFLH